MVFKGAKLRIYPTKMQKEDITKSFGNIRFVWNQMRDMLIKRYENNPDSKFPNAFALNLLLPLLKQEYSFLKQSDSTSLQNANKDLIISYKRFFQHNSGYPRPKSLKCSKQSYTATCINNNVEVCDDGFIKLPKLGYLRFKSGRIPEGKIKAATVKRTATHKYYVVLRIECENQVFDKTSKVVGVDMGLANLLITSDNDKFKNVRFDKRLAKRKHYWEILRSRRHINAVKDINNKKRLGLNPKGIWQYKNLQNANMMVAKYYEKERNQRTDYIHKITTDLVCRYDVIVIEDLKSKNMLKNHKLSRAISNASWREIRRQLEYKCQWYDKTLIIVNPYKTSQICSNCGYDDGKHTLDVREWTCPQCGTTLDRDVNAAVNIMNLGLEQTLVK